MCQCRHTESVCSSNELPKRRQQLQSGRVKFVLVGKLFVIAFDYASCLYALQRNRTENQGALLCRTKEILQHLLCGERYGAHARKVRPVQRYR